MAMRPYLRQPCYTVAAMSSYQTFTLADDPATLGQLQAELVRPQPHPIRMPRAPSADDEAFLERCAAELRAVAPAVWSEIAAFAGRVGVPPARGLFLRAGTLPHGCSAFAWRLADGRVIAGRNYDFVASFPNRHLLDTRPSSGFAHLAMNGGMVAGRYDGVNERGLFVALHKVMAQRPERVAPGLPPHLLVRAALETCADAGEAARLLAGVPHLAPFNYILADPEGRLLTLECYARPDDAAGMARFGIRGARVLGVPVKTLRAIAREAGRSHALAEFDGPRTREVLVKVLRDVQ